MLPQLEYHSIRSIRVFPNIFITKACTGTSSPSLTRNQSLSLTFPWDCVLSCPQSMGRISIATERYSGSRDWSTHARMGGRLEDVVPREKFPRSRRGLKNALLREQCELIFALLFLSTLFSNLPKMGKKRAKRMMRQSEFSIKNQYNAFKSHHYHHLFVFDRFFSFNRLYSSVIVT